MTRAALYLRVSTDEQSVESQERQLRDYAAAQGLKVVEVFADVRSGAKRAKGDALDKLMLSAALLRFEVVLVSALDRLTRKGIADAFAIIRALDGYGVRLVSLREPWTDGPTRELLIAVAAWVAEYERKMIRERTRTGLIAARARGVRLGRPPSKATVEQAHAIAELRTRERAPIALIAETVGVTTHVVRKTLASLGLDGKEFQPISHHPDTH